MTVTLVLHTFLSLAIGMSIRYVYDVVALTLKKRRMRRVVVDLSGDRSTIDIIVFASEKRVAFNPKMTYLVQVKLLHEWLEVSVLRSIWLEDPSFDLVQVLDAFDKLPDWAYDEARRKLRDLCVKQFGYPTLHSRKRNHSPYRAPPRRIINVVDASDVSFLGGSCTWASQGGFIVPAKCNGKDVLR